MTDDIKTISTQFSDPNAAHEEHEKHRAQAVEHFGGHVHVVHTNTASIPMHDKDGNHTGHTFLMTSAWKKAPEETRVPDDLGAGTFNPGGQS